MNGCYSGLLKLGRNMWTDENVAASVIDGSYASSCSRRKRCVLNKKITWWIAVWAYLCIVIVIVDIGVHQLNDLVGFFLVFHSNSPKFACCCQMGRFVTTLQVGAGLLTFTDDMTTTMAGSTIGTRFVIVRLVWSWRTFSFEHFWFLAVISCCLFCVDL